MEDLKNSKITEILHWNANGTTSVGRVAPTDLHCCHKPSICKKKMKYLKSTIKWHAVKQNIPICWCA